MNSSRCFRHLSNGFMSAWRLNQFGIDQDLMYLTEKSKLLTISKPDEILIKVRAASLNPIDLRMKDSKTCQNIVANPFYRPLSPNAEGYGQNLISLMRQVDRRTISVPQAMPLILGRDCSGIIVDRGMDVKRFRIGDEVSIKPNNSTHVEAASFPYVACTVWSALCTMARMHTYEQKDFSVLIHAGSGGIGTFAIQLAKAYHARVTTTCKPDANALLKRLGADDVIDYSDSNAFEKLVECGPYDIILDPVNTDLSRKSVSLLGLWRGCMCVNICNPLLGNTDNYGLGKGFLKSALKFSYQFIQHAFDGRLSFWGYVMPNGQILEIIKDFVESGQSQIKMSFYHYFNQVILHDGLANKLEN